MRSPRPQPFGRLGAGLILMLAALPVAAGHTVEAPALPRPVVVDGDVADWAGVPAVALGDDLGTLAIASHGGDLYLLLQLSSRSLARELLGSGLLLWFDGNGKARVGDEEFGLRYGCSRQLAAALDAADRRPGEAAPRGDAVGPPPERRHAGGAPPRVEPGELTVIRFGLKERKPEAAPQGPTAASAFHDGIFCYELRIPLADIGGKAAERPPTATRRVAIGLEVGGLTEAERDLREGSTVSPGAPGGSTHGGGGISGGGSGWGMGGVGHGGGRGPGEPSAHEPKIEWLKVTLPPGG